MFKKPRHTCKYLILLAILSIVNGDLITSRAVIRTQTHNIDASPHNHNNIIFDGPEE